MIAPEFLEARPGPRPWEIPEGGRGGFVATDLFLGNGANPLEVAIATAISRPNVSDVRQLWKRRKGNRPSPLLLVVLYPSANGDRGAVCGPVGDDPAVQLDLNTGQIERVASTALDEPDRNAAIRFLGEALPEADSELPGIRNQGMFATHQLKTGVPQRADWDAAVELGRSSLNRRGRELVASLGFEIEELSSATSVLRIGESRAKAAVAVFLEDTETPDGSLQRFDGVSPVSAALEKADVERLPYVVVTRGPQIRVYAAGRDVGVGRKGRTDTFVEANLALLPSELAGYLPLLFGAGALGEAGSFQEILDQSQDFAVSLGERLRDRVYVYVVPQLARAISSRYGGPVTEEALEGLYEEAMMVLFRLLFIAYAEDKDLLPYRQNGLYQRNALKTLARDLAELAGEESPDFDPHSIDLWSQAVSLWRAIDQGNSDWDVPAYNGGMFSSDPTVSRAGASLAELELANSEFGPSLYWLLVDKDTEGYAGPVDFRSLSVREFGTIYEGLLESSLSFAQVDLTVDSEGTYLPAGEDDEIAVEAGDIHLQNRSGTRKATGSYFTKPFAVAHLLNDALEPALESHLERVSALLTERGEADAVRAFFDFRVADLAMGSGHFLVAAVDHIEAQFSNFLARNPIPGVLNELERLRSVARESLGDLASTHEIEDSSLLRRQVARRCVYGVDLNLVAVELARLGMWIHTFVPGLPLSFLDHNLVQGNSLTGIATVDEAVGALTDLATRSSDRVGTPAFGLFRIDEHLARADDALRRLAQTSDASAAEVRQARDAHVEARAAVAPVERLLDLLVAERLDEIELPYDDVEGIPDEALDDDSLYVAQARRLCDELDVIHFPIAFPEVFRRDNRGFDVIVGNPPWDKVRFEAQQYWVTRSPGLNALSPRQRNARIAELRRQRPGEHQRELVETAERERLQHLFSVFYELQGRSHHDYAKLFLERALSLGNSGSRIGFVLPRQMLVLRGWVDLRRALFADGEVRLVQARNKGGWLFDDVHNSFMVVLIARDHVSATDPSLRVWGAVKSLEEFQQLNQDQGLDIRRSELDNLSDLLVVPWLNSLDDAPVFEKLRGHSSLGSSDSWVVGQSEDRWDFSGSGRHKDFATEEGDHSRWRVLMARHVDQYTINTSKPFRRYVPEIGSLIDLDNGVVESENGIAVGEDHPMLVYRYPSRSDDARTVIATALPARGFLPSKGYVHSVMCMDADLRTQLALLGFMNSFACDWWTRRFVDRHVTAPVIRNLRLPDWSDTDLSAVAGRVKALLVRSGTAETVGGQRIEASGEFERKTDHELIAEIEAFAARGFGLGRQDYDLLLEDFSDTGCPTPLRELILEHVE